MILGALSLAMWFFQFGKKMVNRSKYMMDKKNEEITESEEEQLQKKFSAKENQLMPENLRLNEIIENMEANYSTFISERKRIMQVEVDMYKDELMGNLQEKLIQKLGEMVLCINKAGEAYHIAECHHLRGHFSSLKRYRSCRECYGRAVRAVIRFVETRQHRQLVKHGEICARMTVQINSHLPTIAGPTWSERNRTRFFSVSVLNHGCRCKVQSWRMGLRGGGNWAILLY